MRRQQRDQRLVMLRGLTGLRRQDDLIELGRIADEILDRPAGEAILADWLGRSYAVGVVRGSVSQLDGDRLRTTGEVFVTAPYEQVDSLGAVVIITTPTHATTLNELLSRGRQARDKRPSGDHAGDELIRSGVRVELAGNHAAGQLVQQLPTA